MKKKKLTYVMHGIIVIFFVVVFRRYTTTLEMFCVCYNQDEQNIIIYFLLLQSVLVNGIRFKIQYENKSQQNRSCCLFHNIHRPYHCSVFKNRSTFSNSKICSSVG